MEPAIICWFIISTPVPESRLASPLAPEFSVKMLGSKNGYQIAQCTSTGHGFVVNRPSLAELADIYSVDRSAHFFSDDLRKQVFPGSKTDAFRYVKMFAKSDGFPGSFLEIWCGMGVRI